MKVTRSNYASINKYKMKIYIMSGACYSEDGDLMSYARAFKDLESAKAGLKKDFEENTQNDDHAAISENGMMWFSHGANQTHCEIIES